MRGYNFTWDTTYRSPRPSRLSPKAQRQAGGTLPESHPTTYQELSHPPACPTSQRGRVFPPPLAGGGGHRGEAARAGGGHALLELTLKACLDLQIYEPQGQEASQGEIPPADPAHRPADAGNAALGSGRDGAATQR